MKFRITTCIYLFSLIITCAFSSAQEPLPKWMTTEEKAIFQDYLDNLPEGKSTQPPDSPPRTPAEFEEAQGVIISWTAYTYELREIVRSARQHVTVYIICSNPSNVQNFLTNGDVPLTNIVFIQTAFDSVWVRDYGPQSIYLNETDELALVDWVYNRPRPNDNQIPGVMSGYLDLPFYQMTTNPNKLHATGGNFMTDGHGKGFSSSLILAENSHLTETQVDAIMYSFKGIDTYIKMPELQHDNISHLDMHMKLLDEETLLVGEFPPGQGDHYQIEDNLNNLLNTYNTCYDRTYNVVRIPMVPSSSGNYPPHSHYRTYTNSVILNGLVLVPIYGHYLDDEALQIYQDAMPGYTIVGINSESIISASGAIHCITREIASHDPVFISHAALEDRQTSGEDIEIKAVIKNYAGISSAKVFWTTDISQGFSTADMTLATDTFYAHIPAQICPTQIHYYISATNNNQKTITKPFVAPDGYYSFSIEGDGLYLYADKTEVYADEEISFTMEFCSEDVQSAEWNFGEGANPQTASGAGPHNVFYTTPGYKTVSLVVNGDYSITEENYILVKDENSFILMVSKQGEGSTDPEPGTYYLEPGSTHQLSASAAEGWEFKHWEITGYDDPIDQNEFSLILDTNIIAKAVFLNPTSIAPVYQPSGLKFSLFPNPGQGQVFVNIAPTGIPGEMLIMNMHGQVVYKESVPASDIEIQKSLNLTNLPSGTYFVRISNGRETNIKKLILQK